MVSFDSLRTQGDLTISIASDLKLAGFESAAEIGHGGFGVVYRCEQPALDRIVAVKVLTSDLDPENMERFLREQRAMGKLSGHPNIVSILFSGVISAGRPYIVMPFHTRKSLQDTIQRDGPLLWSGAVRVAVKMAGALESAHRGGVLHRDVKPGNILLSEYGEPELTDFGIAHVSGGFVTTTGVITGSPAFTAPEVLKGHPPTAASDIYSLGATLFCLITGHAAFERRAGEKVVSQFLRITSEPIPNLRAQEIPDDVCTAIERAMSEDPADRYASAAAFGRELMEIQRRHGLPIDQMALPTESAGAVDNSEPSAGEISTSSWHPSKMAAAINTPPTASTKFRPPTPTRPLVMRDRLIEVLRAGQRRRLIVIHAPAGFGKSTLAAQWRDILTADGVHVAWLSVDHDDNNVVWFLAHLIEAVRQVLPTLAAELGQLLELHGDEAEPYVLTSLINDIHTGGERVAVVIDDWHRVTHAPTVAALGYLLDHGCHHLQVIVTSRTHTGLPLSKMRVYDELVEIDSNALRFNLAEANSFFAGVGGLALEPADIADLTESTDGWVAALQLASLSLRGAEDPSVLIGHMSGRHHSIGDFLAENVLDGLEPRLLEFVLRTSITHRLCGDLASALSGIPDGTARLDEVESRDLFLRRVDADREWFRYHHLFADFLRRRLERDHSEWIPDLHRAASRWFGDHHFLREAVDHALAAGDSATAVALIESDGTQLLEQSQMSTLLALIAKLPPEAVRSSLRLQITTAWANLLLQHPEAAKAALVQVHSLLEHDQGGTADDLATEAAVVEAAARVTADRIDGVAELISDCLARPERLHPWVVTTAADMATFAAIYRFDFAAAHRWQVWAAAYHRQTTGPFSVMYGHCFDGIAANEELDIATAEASFRTALRVAMQTGGSRSHAARIASALLGALLLDKGDIDAAERLLDEGYELGREGGIVDSMLATYGTGARIKALRGDLETARQRLTDGWRIATTLSLPRLGARIRNESIRVGIVVPAADHSRYRAPLDPDAAADGILLGTAELEEASAIRELLARESITEARTRAQRLVDRITPQGRPRALLQARLLLVVCTAELGELEQAGQLLLPVARQCAEQGLTGLLRYGDPAVRTVLRALAEDEASGRVDTLPEAFLTEVLTPL
ncbi:protein kinase [Nocardia sp. NBC_00565]|uniref:protein kinase domain-containing protein n=1 Tax=Nocardia sp. NBC_00565 TaxID=2975993 RepID=UPI002E804F1D|nr:protein kinase [Nocardia sp. NBC_00565]WUC06677.1 protein kinase [Nocardia sp. NBC_00565]